MAKVKSKSDVKKMARRLLEILGKIISKQNTGALKELIKGNGPLCSGEESHPLGSESDPSVQQSVKHALSFLYFILYWHFNRNYNNMPEK